MFQYVRIEANNARGKRIEQYYRPLRYQYEKKREGWLPRPFALSEANQEKPGKKILIPYDDIVRGCLQDIVTWNNTEHSKIKGMSRWDVFLAMQHPNVRPTNYHGILPYLGYKTHTSVHAGIINFREKEFLLGNDSKVSTGDSLISLMRQVEGKDIDIYWLDDNQGNVLKAHIYLGTQFICEAVAIATKKVTRHLRHKNKIHIRPLRAGAIMEIAVLMLEAELNEPHTNLQLHAKLDVLAKIIATAVLNDAEAIELKREALTKQLLWKVPAYVQIKIFRHIESLNEIEGFTIITKFFNRQTRMMMAKRMGQQAKGS